MSAQSLRETRPAWSSGDTHPDTSCKRSLHIPDGPISDQFLLLAGECESIAIDTHALLAAQVCDAYILQFVTQHLIDIHTAAKRLLNGFRGITQIAPSHAVLKQSSISKNLATLRQHKLALLAWAAHTKIEQNFLLKAPEQSENPEELTVIRPRLFAA